MVLSTEGSTLSACFSRAKLSYRCPSALMDIGCVGALKCVLVDGGVIVILLLLLLLYFSIIINIDISIIIVIISFSLY